MRLDAHRQRGLSYVEVLVAVIVIAALAGPTADAIRTALMVSDGVVSERFWRTEAKSYLERALAGEYVATESIVDGGGAITRFITLSDGSRLTIDTLGYDIDNADRDNNPNSGRDANVYLYVVRVEGTAVRYQGLRFDQ
ncbi:MAG: hypothetical protein AAF610_07110 [Pseudomonadota bacterium]